MNYAATLIHIIHVSLIFIILGGVFLPCHYLPFHIALIILIFLDWNDLDGMCILTRLEHYFKTGDWKSKTAIEGGPEFFRPYVNIVFNLNLTREQASRLNNFLFMMALAISFARYTQCRCRK